MQLNQCAKVDVSIDDYKVISYDDHGLQTLTSKGRPNPFVNKEILYFACTLTITLG